MSYSIRKRGKEGLRGKKQILGSSLGAGDCEAWVEVAPALKGFKGFKGLEVTVLLLDAHTG